MSADFNTFIKMNGTKEEIMAMLKVLKTFKNEKREQYREKHNCEYIDFIQVNNNSDMFFDKNLKSLDSMSDEELLKFIATCENGVFVSASGPWGSFGYLDEITLFDEMAIAAPNATFQGSISGFNTGGDQDAEFKLIDGLLHSRYAFQGDEYYDEYDDNGEDEDEDEEIEWDFEIVFNPITKEVKEI